MNRRPIYRIAKCRRRKCRAREAPHWVVTSGGEVVALCRTWDDARDFVFVTEGAS